MHDAFSTIVEPIAPAGYDDLRFEKIDRKAYDKPGNLRQKGEGEYRRCFTERTPKRASFAEATRQAQKLLSTTLNTR